MKTNLNNIKINLDELDSKFISVDKYLSDEMINNDFLDILKVIFSIVIKETKDINECLENCLQNKSYKRIIEDSNVMVYQEGLQSANISSSDINDTSREELSKSLPNNLVTLNSEKKTTIRVLESIDNVQGDVVTVNSTI